MECLEEMGENLPRERHMPKLRPRETQHHQTSSSNYDLDLLSPFMVQQSSNKTEPLMRPAVSSCHSAASIDTGCEVLTRKPVLPPRPSSISSIKQPWHSELPPLMPRDSNLEDAPKDNSLMAPKAFRKPHRFLGCNKGGGWSFVGINLICGTFNYGPAKALDLAWNWIVGRGVQALLMLLAYHVFTDSLLRAAEMTSLSYELYAQLSLYTTSINVLWHVLKALCQKGNWRTKAIFLWLCISIIYVVSFPSLMDASSGYEFFYNSFFVWPNSTKKSTDHFKTIDWHNNQFHATTTMKNLYSTVTVCTSYLGQRHFREMILHYWNYETLNSTWWSHFQSDPFTSDYYEWYKWGFYPTNASKFECKPASGKYQWGFSSEWLFGLWIVWLDCDTNSELCKKGRRLGLWRAIADISEAMREELGPNICTYLEKELAEALKNKPPIKYYVKHGTEQEPGHIGLSTQSSGRVELRWDHEYGTLTHGKLKRRSGHENGCNEME
ncbi:hypothetical protein NA56DRAFT_706936 [Hyaloscypha hepaticicola]|uniref:Uncharacterized protein n=1 Tax=Hyaloscypha hepaticicola TaxID=2082293 RepID=A0A2J6PWE5_9HELO|nr:hypothetical protein NA56DRAFT_706936 [Hyaloscypha hepaticicola]